MTTFREFSSVVNTSDGYLPGWRMAGTGKGPPALNLETGTLSLYDISGGARVEILRCGYARESLDRNHSRWGTTASAAVSLTSPAGEGRGRIRLPIQRMTLRLRRGKIGVKHTYRLLEKRGGAAHEVVRFQGTVQ